MKDIPFCTPKSMAHNLVFIDGIGRCGKTAIAHIIASLDNMELVTFSSIPLEQIVYGTFFGGIKPDCASAILNTILNEMAYNLRISRFVDFRYDDLSSAYNYKDPTEYFRRLSKPDGDAIVEELNTIKPFVPFVTHDFLSYFSAINQLNLNYKLLELIRNPIDVTNSLLNLNVSERIGNDPRYFEATFNYKGTPVARQFHNYEENWIKFNAVEKCAFLVINMTRQAISQYNKSEFKDRVHFVKFENFCVEPFEEISKICSFLKTKTTSSTDEFVRKARCPRIIDLKQRDEKIKKLKPNINSDLFNELLSLAQEHEETFFNLPQK